TAGMYFVSRDIVQDNDMDRRNLSPGGVDFVLELEKGDCMTKVVFAACLLVAGSFAAAPLALAKDPTQLLIHKGARVGVINMMDAEVTHFHTSKVLAQSFFKTQLVSWQVDSMLNDAVTQRLTQLELVPVAMG